ncbi:Oxidoreductase phnG [Pseudocercospora fuligena]|uniref:Oxidoreductase phnG n=1 Tax=Pseudocercospora fuligena TaxID=685502 RepID=A0A8H6RIV7_9PEZI|nr:Oxidoreductase phnG [Pseudocercospora fuligena]
MSDMPGYNDSWSGNAQPKVRSPIQRSPIQKSPGGFANGQRPVISSPMIPGHVRSPTDEEFAGFQSKQEPTGLAAEPLNIIILGASFTKDAGLTYRLILVGPSTHIYWNIGAPRAIVKSGLVKSEDQFLPIEPGFHKDRAKNFTIIQGKCVSMDATSRTVSIECTDYEAQRRLHLVAAKHSTYKPQGGKMADLPKVQTLPYHALIMCTGTSARSELLSLHGQYLETEAALNKIHQQISHAKSIVICGGGCSGVEVAGQLATYLNFKRHFPFRQKSSNQKQITLLSGGDTLLKEVSALDKPDVSLKAEKLLKKLGVVVRHGIRVTSHESWFDQTGATRITFEDGTTHITDVYIDCTGVEPNSDFAPESIKTSKDGYILTNNKTLRVDVAGERVYALGDVASYSKNYVLDVYHGVPVVMQNLLNDLLFYEWRTANPYSDHKDKLAALEHKEFDATQEKNSQICPITKFGGAGILGGLKLPSLAVWGLKGRNYVVHKAKMVVVNGGNPYAMPVQGDKYYAGSKG